MKNFAASLVLGACLLSPVPLFAEANGISKQHAIDIAARVFAGRVLAVKRQGEVYRIKILSEHGEVRIIVVDASSGEVLSD